MRIKILPSLLLALLVVMLQATAVTAQKAVKPLFQPQQIVPQSKSTAALPDLIVKRIWLDDNCHINFELANASKGDISANALSQSRVQLLWGTQKAERTIHQLDPKTAWARRAEPPASTPRSG